MRREKIRRVTVVIRHDARQRRGVEKRKSGDWDGGGGGAITVICSFPRPVRGWGRETDRQTDRDRDRKTDRQTETQAERQRAPVRILIVPEEATRATSLPSQSVLVLITKQQLHVFTICLSLRCVDRPVPIVRVG